MIGHDEARVLLSARAGGELYDAVALSDHLASCEDCRAFDAGIARLSTLASRLEPITAPPGFSSRVLSAVRPSRRRLVSGVAAAAVVAAMVVLIPSVTRFALPSAGAAEALQHIATMEVVRVIEDLDESGHVRQTTREHIWFRAPGFVRTERTVGGKTETIVERPGARSVSGGVTETGLAPSINLPEPLSPTILEYGVPDGDGPVIAGRQTRRVTFDAESITRVAFVDPTRYGVFGDEVSAVLGKDTTGRVTRGVQTRKRTSLFRLNEPIPLSLFDVPASGALDRGFTRGSVSLPPSSLPRGFRLVTSGSGPNGEAIEYAAGALSILIESSTPASVGPGQAEIGMTLRVGSVSGQLVVGLYSMPRLTFAYAGRQITISAPLAAQALASLAAKMYPV